MFGGEELTRQLAAVFDGVTARARGAALVHERPAGEVR
jgi:hypothetical protein